MMNIDKRIESVKAQITHLNNSKIAVYFQDGSMRLLDGGECVDLILNRSDVERFEAMGPGNGALPDLLNGLLEG